MNRSGSLACVGLGMMLGAHVSPRSRTHIERADVVFVLVSDPLVELWVQEMRPDARSLQPYYQEGKSRLDSYNEMVEAMLLEIRAGRQVCGVFYGHPGVFALVPHKAIARARGEGFTAHMEPGISAEDCLYADLGIDPGTVGCQHYEASQLLFYKRRIDPTAYLVLWQAGVAGDRSLAKFSTGTEYRSVLVDVLARDYPLDHPLIIYRAATLPIEEPRIERVRLADIANARVELADTLVIPPARPLEVNQRVLARLARLERAGRKR